MFINKKREGRATFVCAVSLYVAETPKASIKDQVPQLPIIPFGIVAYSFVGQPFSKQLYIQATRQFSFCYADESILPFSLDVCIQTTLQKRKMRSLLVSLVTI